MGKHMDFMKGLLRSVLLVMLGLLLLFMSGGTMTLLVRILGVVFLFPALFSSVRKFAVSSEVQSSASRMELVVDLGSLMFGLCLVVSPVTFVGVFAKMLALLVLVLSVYHLYKMVLFKKRGSGSYFVFLIPLVMCVISVLILADVVAGERNASILLGIGLLVSGIADFVIIVVDARLKERESVIPVTPVDEES